MAVSPINAASDVLDRADELLKLDVAATPMGVREDVRRQAWVMGVAAIDTYLHWAVHRVDLEKTLPKELRTTTVPLSDLIDIARSTVTARQKVKPNKRAAAVAVPAASAVPASRQSLQPSIFDLWSELGTRCTVPSLSRPSKARKTSRKR